MSKSKKKEIVDLGHMLAGKEEGKILSENPLKEAKTIFELTTMLNNWHETFRQGASGNQQKYAEARDARKFFEEKQWVPLDYHNGKIQKLEADNQKLTDKINNMAIDFGVLSRELATAKDFRDLAEKRSTDLFKRIWEAQKILTQWGGTRFAESLVEKLRTVLALPEEETEK